MKRKRKTKQQQIICFPDYLEPKKGEKMYIFLQFLPLFV